MANFASRADAPTIAFPDAEHFGAWLDAQVDRQAGVWLRLAKNGSGIASLTSDEAVDVGLCYGWISGQRLAGDAGHYLQKYVPRRPRSLWSQVNVAKVETLTAAGRMRPAGLAEVEAAKVDGRWAAAYASQRDAVVPPDLAGALAASSVATRAFDRLGKTGRYAIILKVVTAWTAAVRADRLNRAVGALEADRRSPSPIRLPDVPRFGEPFDAQPPGRLRLSASMNRPADWGQRDR